MKLVSRTINDTVYDVMCLNIKTKEVRTVSTSVGSLDFKSDDKALSYIRSVHDNDEVKCVAIVNKRNEQYLVVMPEEEFIKRGVRVSDMREARAYYKKTTGQEVEEEEG